MCRSYPTERAIKPNHTPYWLGFCSSSYKYLVGCGVVVQLRGLVLGNPWGIPQRLMLISLFFSLKIPLKLKIDVLNLNTNNNIYFTYDWQIAFF